VYPPDAYILHEMRKKMYLERFQIEVSLLLTSDLLAFGYLCVKEMV
jgi:hypothetical protein